MGKQVQVDTETGNRRGPPEAREKGLYQWRKHSDGGDLAGEDCDYWLERMAAEGGEETRVDAPLRFMIGSDV